MFSSIYFLGYKGFNSSSENALTGLKHVNVIIGKNNSGKSSVLDVVGCAHDITLYASTKNRLANLEVDITIDEQRATQGYGGYSSIGSFGSLQSFSKNYDGALLRVSLEFAKQSYGEKYIWKNECSTTQSNAAFASKGKDSLLSRISQFAIPDETVFRRLSAERNIVPEAETDIESIDIYGNGASNLIRKFINHSKYNESFIEEVLLNALNEIMYPEAEFENIRVQQIENNNVLLWEVFLQEKNCDRFALSQSGSGLKTIILLILNLLVIPQTNEYQKKRITYGFEELENNLHPALQRRAFDYIYNFAVKHDTYIFLTTHSHVAINAFFDKDEAAIYHVIKDKNVSVIKKIDNYIDKVEILNDLDVKASDLLQSNGIIWVEGPSDRIYVKRWLEVFCDCKYKEGKHYQFMYYGGRLLSHFTVEETTDLINILTTNRNAAIIMDSDKRNRATPINNTKKRIIEEFKNHSMFAWITQGKEIENYVSADAIRKQYDNAPKHQCEIYAHFPDYIDTYCPNFRNKKVPFANDIREYISVDNSKGILDLEKQIKHLYSQIKSWNK